MKKLARMITSFLIPRSWEKLMRRLKQKRIRVTASGKKNYCQFADLSVQSDFFFSINDRGEPHEDRMDILFNEFDRFDRRRPRR